MTTLTLTPTLARRLAITRQQLAAPQPKATPAGIMDVFRNLGYIQLDPIRAVERTQFLVLWSRLGNYDTTHLDTLLWDERQLFEYWAHAASIVLTENYPIHHLQMRNFARGNGQWNRRIRDWLEANEPFRQRILSRLREDGPLFHNQVEDLVAYSWTSGGWTNDRNASMAFSFLWEQGDIMVTERKGLHRRWALTEHHLPQWANHKPLPDEEIVRQAAQISLRSLGVGTAKHIATHFIKGHYYNLDTVLANLVAEKIILPVTITDNDVTWPGEWYIHAEDVPLLEQLTDGNWQPRTTLLSPFDNLIIDRDRTELMWDFFFRIEIYTPQAKRQYGYYVLSILHGDQLIGRIDPKMERKTGTLHINAIYAEPDAPPDDTSAEAIAAAITNLAEFLGARQINVSQKVPPQWANAFSW